MLTRSLVYDKPNQLTYNANIATHQTHQISTQSAQCRARHGHGRMDRQDLIEPSYHSRIQRSRRFFTEAICPCRALVFGIDLTRQTLNVHTIALNIHDIALNVHIVALNVHTLVSCFSPARQWSCRW
eukprot:6544591-Pyramimonas_sp.AAC.1